MTRAVASTVAIEPGGRVFDVTAPLWSGMAVWPGDPELALTPVLRMAVGDEANVSHLSLSTHTGTHVDAPWHFVADGPRLDAIPIERWIGPCTVAALMGDGGVVRAEHLASLAPMDGNAGGAMLVLKTRPDDAIPSADTFDPDFAALDLDAARWLVASGVALVGIDTPSVEAVDGDGTVHRTLLGSGVLIVEGLDLRGIVPGSYTFVCLPMRLHDADGAPARVVLVARP